MGYWGRFSRRLAEDSLFTMVLCAGIVGAIALLTYIRYEGALVPVVVTLAGAAVLLPLGYVVHRPLVRAGYILVGFAAWLALTHFVLLGVFAFGNIGVLGTALWILVSAFAVFGYVSGDYQRSRQQVKTAEQARAEQQRHQAAAAQETAAASPLDRIIARLPEARRVSFDGRPAWRVKRRTFAFFESGTTTHLTVKLARHEAETLAAADQQVERTRYIQSGYVAVRLPAATDAARWDEIEGWIRTSYTQRAPKKLARAVLAEDQRPH